MLPSPPVQTIATTLESVTRRLSAHGRAAARAQGLTLPQVLTLRALRDATEPTPARIAQRTGLSRSSMTSILDRLEADDLVRRKRSPTDRRSVQLVLTDAGQDRASHLEDPVRALLQERLGKLSSEELTTVAQAVEILAASL